MLYSSFRAPVIRWVAFFLLVALLGCSNSGTPVDDPKAPASDPKQLDRLLGTGRVDADRASGHGHRFIHFGTGRVVMTYNGEAGTMARVYSVVDGKPITPPLKHGEQVLDVTLSPDGRRVVTAGRDRTARVWDIATGKAVGEPCNHDDEVIAATFSPDGKKVLTVEIVPRKGAGSAHLWNAESGKRIGEPLTHEDMVMCAGFSPDGRKVVTGCADGAARVWDAATGKLLAAPMKHRFAVVYAEFSPDGTKLVTAAGQEQTACVWDAATGKPITPLLTQDHHIPQAIFTPDGKSVVTVNIGPDKTVQFWDTTTGNKAEALKSHVWLRGVGLSRDGRNLLTLNSSDSKVSTWKAKEDGKFIPGGDIEIHPLRFDDDKLTQVERAVFSPDGTRVVVLVSHRGSSRDFPEQYVHIWDVAKAERIAIVKNTPD